MTAIERIVRSLDRDPQEVLPLTLRLGFLVAAQQRGLLPEDWHPGTGPLDERTADDLLEAWRLGGRMLEIEQIGHVYERLLDRGARRSRGAHYTPRCLSEPVVRHALEPLVVDELPPSERDERGFGSSG